MGMLELAIRLGVRENAFTHIQSGIVWGSEHVICGQHVPLPTKTSCRLIQLFRRSLSLARTCSQVFTTRLVNPLLRFILVAMILSLVSLMFIVRSHLFLISQSLCSFPWITLSQRITHIKWADLEMRIWRRREAPWMHRLLPGIAWSAR